jgi:hypothetical protein
LVDLDGDQQLDVISGSWPGELYLFRGQGKGKFKEGETLKDRGGKPIKLGSASTAFAADWDGDGKLDLLVGTFSGGQLRIYRNLGTNQAPKFNASYDVLLDGKAEGTVPTG